MRDNILDTSMPSEPHTVGHKTSGHHLVVPAAAAITKTERCNREPNWPASSNGQMPTVLSDFLVPKRGGSSLVLTPSISRCGNYNKENTRMG
jgi:hypothetical protein